MILGQQRRMMPRPRKAVAAPAPDKVGDIIPYDYGATFDITGRPGNVVQDVINISAEGAFVAVAVGYGFEEERGRALQLSSLIPQQGDNIPSGSVLPGDITLRELPADALITGFRINPRFEPHLFGTSGFDQNGSRATRSERRFSDQPLPAGFLVAESVFERIKSRSEISFLLSILDSGSGRELQDEPTHNLASLGKSDGERPFRLLAQPITFNPRSTIRLQIIERSQGVSGKLFIVFYGYKLLGNSACPEPVGRSLSGPAACPIETIGSPSARVIPFDYVARLELTGRRQNVVETETTINAEGGFVARAVGYGLLVEEIEVPIQWARATEVKNKLDRSTSPIFQGASAMPFSGQIQELAKSRQDWLKDPVANPLPSMNLADLPLRLLPTSALIDGIRIKPDHMRIAFENNGSLASDLPVTWLDEIFERLNTPEDVSFRYSIYDSGRGRDLQNQPLHNVAGLGIANGNRPFKKLARSMLFLPRSTIRVRVEEVFGRGMLFIVFHGFKFLATTAEKGVRR
jgi:hypothetical protein